jgi:signal transduction histidine kinase
VHDPLRSNAFAPVDLVYALNVFRATPSVCHTCLVRHLVNALGPAGILVAPPGLHLDNEIATLRAVDLEHGVFRVASAAAAREARRRRPRPSPLPSAALLERVSEHLAPRALVVAQSGEIVATIGDAQRAALTCVAPHPPSLATSPGLALRSSLLDAFVSSLRRRTPVIANLDDESEATVSATPLGPSALSDEPLWLLQLLPVAPVCATVPDDPDSLRAHLVSTTETLRHAMDELATRNLTLKTANDELQITIDELERSNRQFAAMNTELIAVRQEHEHRIEELNALNLDVENLFRAADLAVVVLDEAGRLRRYTPAAGRLFKLARSDLGDAFANLLAPGLKGLSRALREVQAGSPQRRLSVELPAPAGRVAALASVHPYRGDDDRLMGTIVTLTDVSELKAAQDDLQERNVALTRANEDLERFAYIASHDLKSPLRSVRTMLEFLRTDLGDALGDDNREHLQLVADRVHQMEQMIQDLLTYSRLGREARPPEAVAVGDLIRAQLDILDIPETFTVTVQADLPTLIIDVGLFEHVVRNLVDNAIKHHDRPEGRVRIGMVSGTAIPTFEVADDGPGIAERYRERVFEIFQKGGSRSDAGGSGMGLALVKKAVERNGGQISIMATTEERGTTFRFTWPEQAPVQPSDQRA